eukprot:CAMPEP_0174901804 /NCGR_PEP_ID=MMETSP0167-20121228/35783_1 /TAXON_ID=38298 /ORGANISM="Rhodella maculata, Strain CCMP736" /LENGTH=47 /DNA_ID= /DNA_START= /DNA_END= /DNA_ORIENTATION=
MTKERQVVAGPERRQGRAMVQGRMTTLETSWEVPASESIAQSTEQMG